ncbi:MAG: hypothetical protein ABI741_14745 [Ferruginibacter sp.]
MIRTIKLFLTGLILCMAFTACEKEYSEENGNNPNAGGGGSSSGTAIYTLTGTPGACSTPIINGIYTAGTAMNASNTVILTVDVTTVGTYTISTGTSNGISFSGTGTFTITGSQIIILTGSGTPAATGTFSYIPGTNGCSFSITTTNAGPPAVFTLDGAPNACTAPTINGTYTAGTALGSSNTVQLAVTVTTAGSYNITSAIVNGFSFSGGGTLATGSQTITLTGNGTPANTGPAVFTPVAGGCSFTINVTTAGGTSVYTLTGAPNACTAPVIAGTYTAGVPLGAGNTVTVTADVTTAGTYNISTNTANGMTFTGSGTLVVGTAQPIVLTGSGTPTAANTSSFTIGTNGCSLPITAVAPPPAVYTLTGAPGVCNPITVNGSYFTGTALSATTNTVVIEANVTTAGSYTITSNTVNGMTFSKTGVFGGTGLQSVTLAGSGTPVAVGTNTLTAGTAGCTFDVTVTAPTSPCTGLVDGKFVMTGQFTLNGFSFAVATNPYQVSIQDGFITLNAFFPGGNPPAPGTYSIGTVTMHCLYISGTNGVDWNAQSGTVYVSNSGGNTVVEFCNVSFVGVPVLGGPNITATGAGKMVF